MKSRRCVKEKHPCYLALVFGNRFVGRERSCSFGIQNGKQFGVKEVLSVLDMQANLQGPQGLAAEDGQSKLDHILLCRDKHAVVRLTARPAPQVLHVGSAVRVVVRKNPEITQV